MTDVTIKDFVVWSDHHAHSFAYGAKSVPNRGETTRELAGYNVVREIHDYVVAKKVKTVVFLGDMFHSHGTVPTVVMNLMLSAVSDLSKVAKIYMIPGNHDYADRQGVHHSLEMFSQFAEIWDWKRVKATGCSISFDGEYRFSFVPFTEDKVLLKQTIDEAATHTTPLEPHILFGHFGIQGGKVGSDYVLESPHDIAMSDIKWDAFAGCLFGHYHDHQKLFKNGWYVGATHQHNWGDANSYRGFLHVRVHRDYISFDKIETNSAPKFVVTKDLSYVGRKGDFIRILTDKALTETEAGEIRSRTQGDCEIVTVQETLEPTQLELSEDNLSPFNMVPAWVTAHEEWRKSKIPQVAVEELVRYGRDLLIGDSND